MDKQSAFHTADEGALTGLALGGALDKPEEEKKEILPYVKFKNLNDDKESKPIPAVEVGIKITF